MRRGDGSAISNAGLPSRAAEKGAPRIRRNCGRIAMHIPIKDGLSIAWTRRAVRDFNRYLLSSPHFPPSFPPSLSLSISFAALRDAHEAQRAIRMHVAERACASAQAQRCVRAGRGREGGEGTNERY